MDLPAERADPKAHLSVSLEDYDREADAR